MKMQHMSPEELDQYIKQEQLDKIIDFDQNKDFVEGVYDAVSGQMKIPFPPVKQDLVQLHKLIREKHFFTILEFGIGYSTLVMADALLKNQADFEKLTPQPPIRNRFKFQLFSVDTSEYWIKKVSSELPDHLKDRIHISYSDVKIGTYQDQLCSYYQQIPDIIPDFIYLDGPNPKDVKGDIHGMSFQCDERTVMSGDLLLMETTFFPGTHILIDGRVNNVRFLERNFKRSFVKKWYKDMDLTLFELDEDRLGKYNILGTDLFPNAE